MQTIDGKQITPLWRTVLVALLLFAATATVVVWQNSRLTVLYDLCGVLENSYRMSLGEIPYRDFPFPYAPLTFIFQAVIIKLFGAIYWHHIAYAAIAGGIATVLTWRIILNILKPSLPNAGLIAFVLSIPLVILGIYCIFPHPFYDPDSILIILAGLLSWQILERNDYPLFATFLLGMWFVVPLFSKQNIGLAFLGSTGVTTVFLTIRARYNQERISGYATLIAGIIIGFGIALLIIHETSGLGNYWYWTMTFAQIRRTPSFSDMLSVYQDWSLPIWLASFAIGVILLWKNESRRWVNAIGSILITLPFLWTVIYLLIDPDASERAERLVGLFPFVFFVAFAIGIFGLRKKQGIACFLPFILIATMHGVFLSQQLWGSTYAVWALLLILVATILVFLFEVMKESSARVLTFISAIICATLLISGGAYVYANERLDYVSFDDGEMEHSKLPPLNGLSMRGTYISDFEELVDYVDKNIPADDGILSLPGEDLFYFTTGRKPRFSVLLFDVTNNPLTPAQILQEVKDKNIRWLIVKNDLEIEADNTIDSREMIFNILKPEFKHLESLNNYEIYRLRNPADPVDDDDDSESDDNP